MPTLKALVLAQQTSTGTWQEVQVAPVANSVLGLDGSSNYVLRALASQAQAEGGTDNTTILTPLRGLQSANAALSAYFDAHPLPVVADQSQAEAGSDNATYMTPLRVKQAGLAQIGDYLAAGLTDNLSANDYGIYNIVGLGSSRGDFGIGGTSFLDGGAFATDGSGNVTCGTVTADAFIGDGSGLTNLPGGGGGGGVSAIGAYAGDYMGISGIYLDFLVSVNDPSGLAAFDSSGHLAPNSTNWRIFDTGDANFSRVSLEGTQIRSDSGNLIWNDNPLFTAAGYLGGYADGTTVGGYYLSALLFGVNAEPSGYSGTLLMTDGSGAALSYLASNPDITPLFDGSGGYVLMASGLDNGDEAGFGFHGGVVNGWGPNSSDDFITSRDGSTGFSNGGFFGEASSLGVNGNFLSDILSGVTGSPNTENGLVLYGGDGGLGTAYWVIGPTGAAAFDTIDGTFVGSLDWTSVGGTPTTVLGYGILDALSLDYIGIEIQPYSEALDVLATNDGSYLTNISFWSLQDTPTTLLDYGITDAVAQTDIGITVQAYSSILYELSAGNGDVLSNLAWSVVYETPTTLAGYGITDAVATADIGITVQAASDVLNSLSTLDSGWTACTASGDKTITLLDYDSSGVSGTMQTDLNTAVSGSGTQLQLIAYNVEALTKRFAALEATLAAGKLPNS